MDTVFTSFFCFLSPTFPVYLTPQTDDFLFFSYDYYMHIYICINICILTKRIC